MRKALLAVLCSLALVPAAHGASGIDLRFETFNASLNRGAAGQLKSDLMMPDADTVRVRQIKNVAEVIQRVRPDVLVINEFDFEPDASRSSATTS